MKRSFVSIFFLSAISIGYAQQGKAIEGKSHAFAALLGTHMSSMPPVSTSTRQFYFDSETTLTMTPIGHQLVNLLSYKDTVLLISVVDDGTWFDEPSVLDTIYADSIRFGNFAAAFSERYSRVPDINTLPMNFFDHVVFPFGIAVGYSAEPTASGKKYLELKRSISKEEQVKSLLLSLNPHNRLIGMLLFDEEKHPGCLVLYRAFIENPYRYSYRYGCGPAEDSTAKEVVQHLRELHR
jgi:hypothetical protein